MTIKRWSKQEKEFLINNYSNMTNSELAEKLDVSVDVVQRKLLSLNLLRQNQKKWTCEEELFLIENFKKMKDKELAEKFKVSEISIKRKLFRLNLKRNLRAAKREKQNLKVNAGENFTPDIVKKIKSNTSKTVTSETSSVDIKTYNSIKTRVNTAKDTIQNVNGESVVEKIIKVENNSHDSSKNSKTGSAPKVIQIVETASTPVVSNGKNTHEHSKSNSKHIVDADSVPGHNEKIYDPAKTYEIGDIIYHKKWEDRGKVVKTIRTAGGNRAIIVHFHKGGEKTLIVGFTPKATE